tara:strand:- start:136 stop:1134 length:999 start_codon:yes stop_codon:yes gene_type:complete
VELVFATVHRKFVPWPYIIETHAALCGFHPRVLKAFTMSVTMTSTDARWKSALIVYYDLEYSGNIRHNFGKGCSIHQIAAESKRDKFFVRINPYLCKEVVEPPVDPKYHMPSKEGFHGLGASDFPTAFNALVGFVFALLKKRKKQWVCMVSHNGFRGDKIVLEHELHYHRLPLPPFLFLDSLLYLREVYPGLSSYSLTNLYEVLFEDKFEAHDAQTDTHALTSIVQKLKKPLHGVLYPLLTVPWRNVSGIGYHTEQTFITKGFGDLCVLYHLSEGDEAKTIEMLRAYQIQLTDKVLANIFQWYKLTEQIIAYAREDAQNYCNFVPRFNLQQG